MALASEGLFGGAFVRCGTHYGVQASLGFPLIRDAPPQSHVDQRWLASLTPKQAGHLPVGGMVGHPRQTSVVSWSVSTLVARNGTPWPIWRELWAIHIIEQARCRCCGRRTGRTGPWSFALSLSRLCSVTNLCQPPTSGRRTCNPGKTHFLSMEHVYFDDNSRSLSVDAPPPRGGSHKPFHHGIPGL